MNNDMQAWLIYDYAIPYLLRTHGFLVHRQNYAGPSGNDWYVTDCPIPLDGTYTLPDGTIIEGCGGLELRIKSDVTRPADIDIPQD